MERDWILYGVYDDLQDCLQDAAALVRIDLAWQTECVKDCDVWILEYEPNRSPLPRSRPACA
jgi:hypothetical protein